MQSPIDWALDAKPHRLLRDAHVFDSKSASMYVGSKNEARYEPRRMRFLSSLIGICDSVSSSLEKEKNALVKKMPIIPSELSTTQGAKWASSLIATISSSDIEKNCTYEKVHDDERIAGEQALNEKDIPGKLATVAKNVATLQGVKSSFELLKKSFDSSRAIAVVAARKNAQTKRKAASEDAKKAFGNAPLSGVGQESWLALWEQARKYSESFAYPESAFPCVEEVSHCVLCQQELGEPARQRLRSFEEFVRNGLEAEAVTAEKRLADVTKEIHAMPTIEDWRLKLNVLKVENEIAETMFERLQARWKGMSFAVDIASVSEFDWSPLDQEIAKLEAAYAEERKLLSDMQQDDKRKLLAARVLDLKTAQWLSQNNEAIKSEVVRLGTVKNLEKAANLAKTHALTSKKNELGESELCVEYKARFASELDKLGGARIPIATESKSEGKGKISFGLALKGAKKPSTAVQVLSEGETRIVALAAFLADMGGASDPNPFIFDDPISSLDQTFEEKVVSRLIDLSMTRQVIVFTHRLSLVTLIENAVEHLKKHAKSEGKDVPATCNVQSLYRLGKTLGIVNQLSIRESNPQRAANRLRDESVKQLAKLHSAGDVHGYQERAKSVCSDFRILVESCVEKILMNDVVVRFRRSVETQNKIGSLAKITPEDCTFIETLMTRYSAFEHSQPDELPAKLPDFDVVEKDVEALAKWIGEFKTRSA